MREIKFRAWKIADGHEMFDDIAFIDWNKSIVGVNYPISSTNTRLDKEPLDNVVIEQYTGLKDKNGVEIYENDIVMWRDGESIRYAQVAFTPDIKFLTCDYVFSYGRFAYKDTENHLTVIGNIHENVDLLVNDTDRISPDDIGNDIHEFLHGGDK